MKILSLLLLAFIVKTAYAQPNSNDRGNGQNWTHYVRTAGHGLSSNSIESTIKDAVETHLYGIEVDNNITGRYDSFLNPAKKLADLKTLAERAHAINNKAYVYITGLECITPNADKSEHSLFKDHPDWVQRDINNNPAIFGGGEAFWIRGGDEDVWISPYALEWRKLYMEHVRKIAATGIDGIYVDVPYWMSHFKSWTDRWASFDDYTVEAFRKRTGLNAKKDLKLGDYSDANFRKWIAFRIETITEFMAEIDRNAKSVNPKCMTIAEIYPGLGDEKMRIGTDVYEIYKVVDVIAHELTADGGPAASKDPLNWFDAMAGMYTFRAFAEGKASWMLSYSWEKANTIDPVEPMKNLAMANFMAGSNHWDARDHVMSGSNNIATRKIIYEWLAKHEDTFYKPRTSIKPIGVYFSPKTKAYHANAFMNSFQGMMRMMLQGHMEFEIITPSTLKEFKGETLIMPDVKCISAAEIALLSQYLKGNGNLVVTGETGKFNSEGDENKVNPIYTLLKIPSSAKEIKSVKNQQKFIFYPQCPGKDYSETTSKEFNAAAWSGDYRNTKFFATFTKIKPAIAPSSTIEVQASPFILTQTALVEGQPHVFLANFAGLKNDKVSIQNPENNIEISFTAKSGAKVFYLPFMGKKVELETGSKKGRVTAKLPTVEKGGVVWLEN